MFEFDRNEQKLFNKQNKNATIGIIAIGSIIAIGYILGLAMLLNPMNSYKQDLIVFIRTFSAILALLAITSCILCYMSTKKEEFFIISFMYISLFIDISLGIFDNMILTDSVIDITTYITVSTSLIRISVLIIILLPFEKLKKLIINNKLESIILVVLLLLFMGILRLNVTLFYEIQTMTQFIVYNLILIIVYVIFSSRFIKKSIREKEYIYSVISASIFFFAIKAFYAIVGAINPSVHIKLVSLSITYMAFLIFIGGSLTELALSIKRNKKLKNENQIFYNLVDDSKYSCIVIYDEVGKLKYANKTVKEYLFDNINISNKDVHKVINECLEELDKDIINEIEEHVLTYGVWKGNIKIPSRDIAINAFVQNIYTYEGKINYAYIFKDISNRIRVENSLIEYEKMKNHENIKNEFFANISHELKTPLNIFYSTVQLLDMKSKDTSINFNEVYSNHKQCLRINCQRMLRLINNIVDITKIDVGFTKAKFINCDIVRLVEDITLSVINYANPKDINIIFDTEVEEHKIKCDPTMIERAMLNLLSNAIKFTRTNGNILVSIYNDDEWVHIRVKDDGIGIPIDMQGIIFERFIQSDKSLTRLNEGSGIGLSIVKSIIELNEGEIYLESDEENGTEFEIVLPNKILENCEDEQEDESIYEIDILKIELELSDIYKLYQ